LFAARTAYHITGTTGLIARPRHVSKVASKLLSVLQKYFSLKIDTRRQLPSCYSIVVQKAAISVRDHASAEHFRKSSLDFCKLPDIIPTRFTLLARKGNRKFNSTNLSHATSYLELVASRRNLTFQKVYFEGATFCKQVKVGSQSKIFMAVHGQAVELVSLFLHPTALIVELYPNHVQISRHSLFSSARFQYQEFAPLVSEKKCQNGKKWMLSRSCLLDFDMQILKKIEDLL